MRVCVYVCLLGSGSWKEERTFVCSPVSFDHRPSIPFEGERVPASVDHQVIFSFGEGSKFTIGSLEPRQGGDRARRLSQPDSREAEEIGRGRGLLF